MSTVFEDPQVNEEPRVARGVVLRSEISADRRWEREFGALRARRLAMTAFWFSLTYGLYLFIDLWLVGDVVDLAMALRLGVVTPFGLAVVLMTRRDCSPERREVLSGALVVLAVTTTLAIYLASGRATAAHHHYLAALPILFANVVQRPHFKTAAVVSAASLALYAAALWLGGLDAAVAVVAFVDMVVMVGFSLLAGRNVERELRRAFLRRLRSEKAVDHLSHRNDELRELSQIDTLTGLANRRRIDQRLIETAAWSARTGEPMALLMIDVDRFKQFNDRYGHPEGDRCLSAVARVAREQVRRHDDVLGRFGGEEFLAILVGTDIQGASKVAERIRASVEGLAIPHVAGGPAGVVGVSIGCAAAVVGTDGMTLDDLLRSADTALYAAKRRGRNRVQPSPTGAATDEVNGRPRRIGPAERDVAA